MVALERALGVALIRRSTHECALTPAGVVLLGEARALLESVDRAARLTRRAAAAPAGLIVAAKPREWRYPARDASSTSTYSSRPPGRMTPSE